MEAFYLHNIDAMFDQERLLFYTAATNKPLLGDDFKNFPRRCAGSPHFLRTPCSPTAFDAILFPLAPLPNYRFVVLASAIFQSVFTFAKALLSTMIFVSMGRYISEAWWQDGTTGNFPAGFSGRVDVLLA